MLKNTRFIDFIKSLKFRLILLIIIVVVVPGLLLATSILHAYVYNATSIRESEVSAQAKILANQIAVSEYMSESSSVSNPDSIKLKAQIEMLTSIYDGRVLVVNRDYRIIIDTYNLDTNKMIISDEVINCFNHSDYKNTRKDDGFIEMALPIIDPNDSEQNILGALVVSVSLDNILLNRSYLATKITILEIFLVVLFTFLGILAAIWLVKPLGSLSEGISKIQSGIGEYSLEVNDYTETRIVCEKFNKMLGSMKLMDESRQEFVSNVSHELKTPMTSMKVLADSLNSMPDAPRELYQEFMEDITNEIERETKIINDLLSLVKMDKTAADLNISTMNINELIEQIIKRLQPLADKQQVAIVLESFRPVTAEVDEVKLTLAITNLIENGIKYNRTDGEGWVHVSLNADHQYFYLKVEDTGIGIPEESLEHIYERFYRVDKSHSREIGGTGLGLAITRSSILMHKGAIKAHSVIGEGTTFDVRIPLNYIV